MRTALIFGALTLTAAVALAQTPQLTPRDAFWSASDLVSVSANAGARHTHPSAAAHRPAKPLQTSRDTEPRVSSEASSQTSPQVSERTHLSPMTVSEQGYGAQPHIVRVSDQQIGMRYSLLLQDGDGQYKEVSPTAIFHSGEKIRLSIMANQPGFLYVIDQGSTGSWKPIFPAPGSSPDANRVEPGQLNEIPNGRAAFQFDQHPGDEKLFIILSRQPIADLDSTIERLKGAGATPSSPALPPPPSGQILEASNRIPDDLVQRFASRDLTLVEEQAVGENSGQQNTGEKAVYVVSKGISRGASGPQVVASVTLRHE